MSYLHKIFFIFLIISIPQNLIADTPYFLDFKFILNESNAGKKAQIFLKTKLEKGIKELKSKEKNIQDEEKKIIQQKKIISPEEYKKKINDLRKKVSLLQSERNKILSSVANERAKAKNKILENLNPILSDYMSKNNIKIILDKKNLVRADNSLDITKQIVELLNKKIKSIKIN